MKKRLIGSVLAILLLFTSTTALAQVPPFSGQILAFYRWLLTAANTWTGTQTFTNVTVSGTCTGCGGVSTTPQFDRVGIGVAADATALLLGSFPSVGVTSTDGYILRNPTAATSGNQQWSPRVRLQAQGWSSGAGASQALDWKFEVVPFQASTVVSWLDFGSGLAGSYTSQWRSYTNGTLEIGPQDAIDGGGSVPGAGQLIITNAGCSACGLYIGKDGSHKAQFSYNGTTATLYSVNGTLELVSSTARLDLGSSAATFGNNQDLKLKGANLTIQSAAPTISAGGCTSPAVTWANGSAAFKITIGTTCSTVKTVSVTFAAATNGWVCTAADVTTPASYVVSEQSSSTTVVVLGNYARTTGLAADWVDGEVLLVKCMGG